MLKRIGAEEGGEFKAVASGTLPSGKPVIVNSDGTVSVVSSTAVSQALGSPEVFESASTEVHSAAYDSYNQRVVLAFNDAGNSNQGTAIVGTVNANNTVTYGSPVVFETGATEHINALFDSTNNKIVIIYRDNGDGNKAKGIVGTVDPSDNSISFGSASSGFASSTVDELSAAYTTGGKVVAAYRDTHNSNYGNSNVGTVSGTSITFGSSTYFELGAVDKTSVGYDTANDKVLIFYIDASNSDYPTAIVGTISGTTLSYGTAVVVQSAGASATLAQAYDSDAQKFGLFYLAVSEGKAAVATVSGTSVSATVRSYAFESGAIRKVSAVYHQPANKIIVAYSDDADNDRGKIALPRISGTDMLDPDGTMPSASGQGSPIQFEDGQIQKNIGLAYDSVNKKAVISYTDGSNSDYGTSVVFAPSYNDNNLTSENYIGMSRGVAVRTGSAASVGSDVVFANASTNQIASAFDSNSNRIVIAYRDNGNSNQGTAIVGTISGSSISFGSEVVFESGNTSEISITFYDDTNRVIIAYKDAGNSDYGTAIVGSVDSSDNSISFGTPTVFESAHTTFTSVVEDSNADKVVICYNDVGNSNQGTAIVGTISGTSISFGSTNTFESGTTERISTTFDSNSNKFVVAYADGGDSNKGKAIVGTVSGTGTSFGSIVEFESGTVNSTTMTFDSSNNKVVIAIRASSDVGKAYVGTVSGTSISFGSAVDFTSGSNDNRLAAAVFDTSVNKVVIAFVNSNTSISGISGTVSGTSISFDDITTVKTGNNLDNLTAAFDSNANKVFIGYRDVNSSNHGTANIFTTNTIATTRGEVADGGNVSMDIIGSVSDNQIGLTAGQQYFVQTDGTISTTADSPSVLAGTAISATELVVKT